jgi:type II secretion system protein C
MELINTISTSPTWARHGLKFSYGVACLLLLASVSSAALNMRSQYNIKAANYAAQKIAPIRKKASHSYQMKDVARANLFGNPNPPVISKVTPTTLDLTLQGILAASDDSIARAIIMSGKRNTKFYSIGDTIDGAGVSVEQIRSNEVLINRNGAIESLQLKKLKAGGNDSIISYSNQGSGLISQTQRQTVSANTPQSRRSSRKPRSANGQPRKIKRPIFSGLDRALQKMGEI